MHETGVAAGNVARTNDADAFACHCTVGKACIIAKLLSPCTWPAWTIRWFVVPGDQIGHHFVVQLWDTAQTTQGKRESKLRDRLPPEPLAGMSIAPDACLCDRLGHR